jgi:hypothetical protein
MADRFAENGAMVDSSDDGSENGAAVCGQSGRRATNRRSGLVSCRRHEDPLPGHGSDTTLVQRTPIRFPANNNADDSNQAPVNNGPRRRAYRRASALDVEGSTAWETPTWNTARSLQPFCHQRYMRQAPGEQPPMNFGRLSAMAPLRFVFGPMIAWWEQCGTV